MILNAILTYMIAKEEMFYSQIYSGLKNIFVHKWWLKNAIFVNRVA